MAKKQEKEEDLSSEEDENDEDYTLASSDEEEKKEEEDLNSEDENNEDYTPTSEEEDKYEEEMKMLENLFTTLKSCLKEQTKMENWIETFDCKTPPKLVYTRMNAREDENDKKLIYLAWFIKTYRFDNYKKDSKHLQVILHPFSEDIWVNAEKIATKILAGVKCGGEKQCGLFLPKGLPNTRHVQEFKAFWDLDHIRDKHHAFDIATKLTEHWGTYHPKAIKKIDLSVVKSAYGSLNTITTGQLLWLIYCYDKEKMKQLKLDGKFDSVRINILIEYLYGSNLQIVCKICHNKKRHDNPLKLTEIDTSIKS